jgi:gliding motility-associated-like protein
MAFSLLTIEAQTTFQYNFNNCSLVETSGSLADITSVGNPQCICGPIGNSYEFDGNNDFFVMPVPGDLLQRDNFTFSFYIRPSGSGSIIQQVFSNKRDCGTTDSLFSIRYFPTIRTVSVRLSDFGATKGLVEAELDPLKCWQQVTLVKQGRILQLYANGILKGQFDGNQPVNIYATSPITIARTLCPISQNITDFEGAIDEIRWYDRALGPSEVLAEYEPVDEVITGDTLIFLGDQFFPRVGGTCALSIQWSPGAGLSSTSSDQPSIGPSATTFYRIQYNYQNCVAHDSLNVTVVDKNDIDCEKLLLPSAFTPNGDNLNDLYGFSNPFIIDELSQFDILDRIGNTVFSAVDASDKWDGMYKGKVLGNGTYIYKVSYTCKNEEYSRTGGLSIIR